MKPQFQLQNALLLMALAAAYPLSASAAATAGVAQFTVGEVNLRSADGKTDALLKGNNIESGQAIVTGTSGRAQVKFSDGGLISLQPNTEFKIASYVDQASPREDRFLVDLLRGSMRAITGLIGKRNRDNYKVTTQTATIGIRGSAFNAGYNPDGSLSVTTEMDAIEVCNAAGCVGLTAGESVLVLNNQALPVRTNTRADVPTPNTKQDPAVVGNQADGSGGAQIVVKAIEASTLAGKTTVTPAVPSTPTTPATPSTPKLLTGVALTSFGLTPSGFDQRSSGNGALLVGDASNSSQPTAYTSADASVGSATSVGAGTVVASSGSLQNGDYLVVGSWAGSSWLVAGHAAVSTGATAFVAGVASPASALSALTGLRASYALKNATPVFATLGAAGSLLPSSKISVDFAGAGAFADINLDISMPAQVAYNLRGTATGRDSALDGTLAVSGTSCALQCGVASVSGGFGGNNAQNILLSYGANSSANGTFGGAASFARTGTTPTPENSSLTDLRGSLAVGGSNGGTGGGNLVTDYYGAGTARTVTPYFVGERLQALTDVNGAGTTSLQNAFPTTGTYGALGVISDPDFLGWGKWVSGSSVFQPTGGGSANASLDAVHYVVGRPTPQAQMPGSGIAEYTFVGGTSPTATQGVISQNGQLMAAALTANFSQGAVAATIVTQFNGVLMPLSQTASINTATANFSASSSVNGSQTSISGFFTGDQAARAGLVYGVTNTSVGNITGAAAFQRTNLKPSTGAL